MNQWKQQSKLLVGALTRFAASLYFVPVSVLILTPNSLLIIYETTPCCSLWHRQLHTILCLVNSFIQMRAQFVSQLIGHLVTSKSGYGKNE
jgi:hypothetical protein